MPKQLKYGAQWSILPPSPSPPVPQQGRSTLDSPETLIPRLLSSIILCLVLNNLLALPMRTPLKLLQTAIIYLIFMRIARALPYMDTKSAWNCYDITDIHMNCQDIFPYKEYILLHVRTACL